MKEVLWPKKLVLADNAVGCYSKKVQYHEKSHFIELLQCISIASDILDLIIVFYSPDNSIRLVSTEVR